MDFLEQLDRSEKEGRITATIHQLLLDFYLNFKTAVKTTGWEMSKSLPTLTDFLESIEKQIASPFHFNPYHQRVTEPFNYTAMGLDLLRPLIIYEKSKVLGKEYIENIIRQLKRGDNVILFANHQTEPDPQAINLLLERSYPGFAEEIIFVAGNRVTTDPMAVPLSMGRNLLCIFSKHYLDVSPDLKQERLRYNQRTMQTMGHLLAEGGKCIYVAPSGGRDRPNAAGEIFPAPFDPQSIEMFALIAKRSGQTTHFYPLSLNTYNLLPPPNCREKKLGEMRNPKCTPIHLAFGPSIDMEHFPSSEGLDKKELRLARSHYIWNQVNENYRLLTES